MQDKVAPTRIYYVQEVQQSWQINLVFITCTRATLPMQGALPLDKDSKLFGILIFLFFALVCILHLLTQGLVYH